MDALGVGPKPGPQSFAEEAEAVLAALAVRAHGLEWLLARREGSRHVVERARGGVGGLRPGDTVDLAESGRDGLVRGHDERGAYLGVVLRPDDDGPPVGALVAHGSERDLAAMSPELPVVSAFARLLAALTAQRLGTRDASRRAERAEVEAMFDDLTGVGNRRWWEGLLQRAERSGATLPATVVCVDLDDLKLVNDTRGHGAGDVLIAQAAAALVGSVRDVDAVARVGGDEFAVLVPGATGPDAAALRDRIAATLDRAGVPASVGLACQEPSERLAQTWQRADALMYRDKRERRSAA